MFEISSLPLLSHGLVGKVYEKTTTDVKRILEKDRHGLESIEMVMDLIEQHWERTWKSLEGQQVLAILTPEQRAIVEKAKRVGLPSLFSAYFMKKEVPVSLNNTDDEEPPLICNGYHWTLLKKNLLERYPEATVDAMDRQSSSVLRHILLPDNEEAFRKTGLVMGQVQSGKTGNFTALISKATDFGYKVVIVLSGIHNDLRNQTQERLDKEYVGFHRYCFTDNKANATTEKKLLCGIGLDGDYNEHRAVESATYTDEDFRGQTVSNDPILFVVKKNTDVLRKLTGFLQNDKIRNLPALIIDDEADQASINTREYDVSTINRDVRRLVKLFNRVAFVGYTATPFANVLIDARASDSELGDDLFPRDFIVRLPAPGNYFGPEAFFGNNRDDKGLELFIPVSTQTEKMLVKTGRGSQREPLLLNDLPMECKGAVYQFLISAAIRQWRDKLTYPEKWEDVDENEAPVLEQGMLVHVSYLVKEQDVIAEAFTDFVEPLREVFLYGSSAQRAPALEALEAVFDEQCKVTARMQTLDKAVLMSSNWELPKTFEELIPEIEAVLEDLSIQCINGESKYLAKLEPTEESFERPHGRNIIYVGGNKLSRGLTLPGLCVSFFLRTTRMYDTLLQMGRWFGYRNGYVDLCRLVTTPLLVDRFRAITEACIDFEGQIDAMSSKHRTPENYRLGILTHKDLMVTSGAKMRNAKEARLSFSDATCEQRNFSMDEKTLTNNLQVAHDFYRLLKGYPLRYASADYELGTFTQASFLTDTTMPYGRAWESVPAQAVIDFLTAYQEASGCSNQHIAGVVDYIKRVQKSGELTRWNVFLPGRASKANSFGVEFPKRKVAGSMPFTTDIDSIALGELKTGGHEYVGVPEDIALEAQREVEASREVDGVARGDLFRAVRAVAGKKDPATGYLILYLISPKLKGPCSGLDALQRHAGESEVPVVSFYLWTPRSMVDHSVGLSTFNSTVSPFIDDEDDDEDVDDE